MNKKRLMMLYSIKAVSSQQYGEGFFDCLQFFDKKIKKFLIDKGIFIEFIEHLAKTQKLQFNAKT